MIRPGLWIRWPTIRVPWQSGQFMRRTCLLYDLQQIYSIALVAQVAHCRRHFERLSGCSTAPYEFFPIVRNNEAGSRFPRRPPMLPFFVLRSRLDFHHSWLTSVHSTEMEISPLFYRNAIRITSKTTPLPFRSQLNVSSTGKRLKYPCVWAIKMTSRKAPSLSLPF